MDTSEGSVNRIGRTIWTVWGYLSGAVARYLSPDVTVNGNQSVNSRADTLYRNTAKNTDRPVKEIDAEKHKEETKYNSAEARFYVATVEWEKTDVVQEDNYELCVDTKITQSYHCKNDHKQTDEAIALDVLVNYEKQTKDEAHIEKEVAASIEHRANIELDGCESKQELKDTEDTEQKDGKEDFDHYNEDDGEEGVMRTAVLEDTEVTDQSVQDVDQKTLINKIEYEETENIRVAEDARDLLGENVVEFVVDKEEQIIYTDQEKTESVEGKETESLVKHEGLPSTLGSSTQGEEDLLKPLENKRLSLLDEYPQNILENEVIQTPERQVIDDISKNVVEIPGTSATSEPDENIEEDEQQKCLDIGELPTTEIFDEKEAHEQMLGEIQTQSLLELVETPSGGSKEICDDSIAHNDIGLKTSTSVNEVVDEICDASEDTLQSDLIKQDSPKTGNHSELTVCELPQEPSNRPAIGLENSGDLDQITAVATSLGSFEEMKANISELHIPAVDRSKSSVMTQYEPLNDTSVKAAEFETPMLSLEIGAKQIQTLQEMAKCSLIECVELRSEQIGESMKPETDSEDKGEVLMTGSEADNEILELNIEKEGILSQATMEPISESLNKDNCESSERDVNRTELAEDSPDPAEAKNELLKSEVLDETQYLQGKSERYTENIKSEVRLLSETDTTITQSYHCKIDDKQTDEAIALDVQLNYENEEKQTKDEAHIEKEVATFTEHRANIEFDGCEPEQELNETEDTEQKDGKEDFDHYNEDDGEEGVMRTEALKDTEVTNQSVQDVEQKTLMNKMENEETENIRITEDPRDLFGENVVKYVFDKEEQIIYKDQEKTKSVEDKETESLVKDEGQPSSLGSSTQDEEDLLKFLEDKRLSLLDEYPNILENEGIQTSERQVIDDISKNVVEIPGTSATSEPDENIEEDEQQKCLDAGELPTTEHFGETEDHEQMLGEIQTQSLLELIETPSGGSKEICDDSIAHNDIGLRTSTSVNEVVVEICDASEDTQQSDFLKQDSPETKNHSDLTVCDLPQEPSKRPAIGLVNSVDLNQITAVATSLGSFEEMKANISELHIPAEDRSQSSVMTQYEPLNDTFVKAAEFETPMLSLEIGAKQIQTLQEMAKCSLKECVELTSEQIGETMKTETDSEDKGEVLMTGSEANNEILELNIEKEGILSQATMETISESLNQDKCESSERDVNRTELAEDLPEPAEAKTELLKSEVLEETQYSQGKSERYTENIKTEVGLLSETDSLDTTVEDVEKIINQVMKELIDTENKCIQETPCDAEIQKPAECLPPDALLLGGEKEMLGDADQSLVQMKVEMVIYEAAEKQKDEHDVFCPVCEPADAGCEQKERDTVGETLFSCHDEKIETDQPWLKTFDNTSKDFPEEEESLVDGSATVDLDIQQTSLDFSVQKSRIALKNPLIRPPKDPRKLINKTSTEPSLQKPPPFGLLKAGNGVGVSIQSKGVVGFKLPVIGELPTLRKTEFGQKVREEERAESRLQVESKSVAQTENSVKQEQASLKPKWTPPKHPGMGSPLMMAELKSKLKAPVNK
ncbi:uncharacterized protein [Paramisgurnus dabryanus]|uniref:uncharacterized protein n=1 Tax=Paramisgurnus dabryanus TaxID=90735 RepID=UPI0031F3C7F8